ncbi:leucine-rich repeat-containing protein 36-like isoform X2 [Alosa alosa]|uniref:leucine-rich repeat-containing protein 36-like isoform X2 n=1 Tax=Alosa alosa TaxID=278164 RepID=UPI0020152425|nr:leucine-rich repeat-containing protein 36-like isoform X2 [Alosa alosa]
MAEGEFKTAKHLPNKTASSTQDSLQDSSKVFKAASFTEEYKPLPRATHLSSLLTTLSPKCPKEKRRVTFLEDYKNIKTSHKDLCIDSTSQVEEDTCSKKQAILTRPSPERSDKILQGHDLSEQTQTKCQSPNKWSFTLDAAPHTLNSIAHFQTEMEASINRLLQLTTDLEIATIVPDRSAIAYHACGLKKTQQPTSPLDHNRQIVTSQPMTHSQEETTETSKVSGLSGVGSSSLCDSPLLPPHISELSAVLRGLLDLVDRHWSGNFSLHLNPNFLEQAYSILSKLKSSSHKETEEKRDVGGNESVTIHEKREKSHDCTEVGHLQGTLTQKSQLTCLQKQLVTALMDNIKLKHEIHKLREDNSSWNNIDRQWQSCLQLQGKVLEAEEKHLKELKDSMDILQATHRSLQRLSLTRTGRQAMKPPPDDGDGLPTDAYDETI